MDESKLFYVPFKPSVKIKLKEKKDDKISNIICDLVGYKWYTDPESLAVKCNIMLRSDKKGGIRAVPLDSYGDTYKVDSIYKGAEEKLKKFKITDNGYIQPLKILIGNSAIIMDGTYVYRENLKSGKITIIGYWTNTLNMIDKTGTKESKKIAEYKDVIDRHKKIIIPYNFSESTIIKTK